MGVAFGLAFNVSFKVFPFLWWAVPKADVSRLCTFYKDGLVLIRRNGGDVLGLLCIVKI